MGQGKRLFAPTIKKHMAKVEVNNEFVKRFLCVAFIAENISDGFVVADWILKVVSNRG
jgi:hypothetical protein